MDENKLGIMLRLILLLSVMLPSACFSTPERKKMATSQTGSISGECTFIMTWGGVVSSKNKKLRNVPSWGNNNYRPFSLSSSLTDGNQFDDDDYDENDGAEDGEFEPSRAQLDWMESRKTADEQVDSVVTKDDGDDNQQKGNVFLPSTGVSVSDEIMDTEKIKISTKLQPLEKNPGIARILSSGSDGVEQPIRYLLSLSPPTQSSKEEASENNASNEEFVYSNKYVMIDIPPYSDKLAEKMRDFMGNNSILSSILVTSRTSIHYQEGPAVYVTRKSELEKWVKAFPGIGVLMYRLDTPRDCKDIVTQRLDGYGPWAMDEGQNGEDVKFVETGRPLTYLEWDEETQKKVLDDGETPPDDEENVDDDEGFSLLDIRKKEEGKRILAVYTPGHTFGSVSYVFPEMGVCCSGFTIPLESSREAINMGIQGAGPKLDYRGYVTTNNAGISRQMSSAKDLVNLYSDRFQGVLPARGSPVFLSGSADYIKSMLFETLQQYEQVGKIYEELGITGPN